MKKRKFVLYIIIAITFLLFASLVILYIVRNSLMRSILERSLSKQLETEVNIEDLDLQIFSKAIRIGSFSIIKKDDDSLYLVKTGKIEIILGSLLPIFFEKYINIKKIHLNAVDFLVSTPSKNNNRSNNDQQLKNTDITSLLNSIDLQTLLDQYTQSLQSIDYVSVLRNDTAQYTNIVDESIRNLNDTRTKLEKEINGISSIRMSTLEEATTVMTQTKKSYAVIEQAYNDGLTLQQTLQKKQEELINATKKVSELIHKDARKIVDNIANPSTLANEISISIITQMLQAPVTKYHAILTAVLEFLEEQQEKNKTQTSNQSPLLDTDIMPLVSNTSPFMKTLIVSKNTHIPQQNKSPIEVETVKQIQIPKTTTHSYNIKVADIHTIEAVKTITNPIVPEKNEDSAHDKESALFITQNTDTSNSAINMNENTIKNTSSVDAKNKGYTVLVRDFLLSVGLGKYPLFSLKAKNISNAPYTNNIATNNTVMEFSIESHDTPITTRGNGTFSFNPNMPMLNMNISSGDIPLVLDEGLETLLIDTFDTKLALQLDIRMQDTKNGHAALLLKNKHIQATPLSTNNSTSRIIAKSISALSPLNIYTNISITEGTIHSLTFDTNMMTTLNKIIQPVIQEQIDTVTTNIQSQLHSKLQTQTDMYIENTKDILDSQLSKLGISITATEELKKQLQENTTKFEKTVQDYISQEAEREAKRIQEQLQEESEKIQEDLKNNTEDILKDLGSNFEF